MKDNLLIKCTKRQSYKAEIARLESLIKELESDIKSELTEEKTIVKPFTIWYKPHQTKKGFNQTLAKELLTEEQRKECETTIEYDYFSIK